MNDSLVNPLPEEVQREIYRSLRGTGKQMELRTTGTSMVPLIPPDIRVPIEFVSPDVIAPGDVVLFERQGKTVLHRIVGRDPTTGSWIEKGDHQPFAGRVRPDEVWGRMIPSGSPRIRRFVTTTSRWEWKIYRAKVQRFGERPTWAGKTLVAIGTGIRRMAACFLR